MAMNFSEVTKRLPKIFAVSSRSSESIAKLAAIAL